MPGAGRRLWGLLSGFGTRVRVSTVSVFGLGDRLDQHSLLYSGENRTESQHYTHSQAKRSMLIKVAC